MFILTCVSLEENSNQIFNGSFLYIQFYFTGVEGIVIARKQRNFYSAVAENEDISKLLVLLSSSVNSIREAASKVLQDFQKYKELWTEDRDAKIQASLMMITYMTVLH